MLSVNKAELLEDESKEGVTCSSRKLSSESDKERWEIPSTAVNIWENNTKSMCPVTVIYKL